MQLRSIRKTAIKNKRVLLRVDFNEPIKNGRLADDFRIRSHIPTIQFLLQQKNSLVIVSHCGRPAFVKTSAGKPAHKMKKEFSLRPMGRRLSRLLKKKVVFVPDPFSGTGLSRVLRLHSGEIVVVENIRLWSGEEKNDLRFAKALAGLGDAFVNDAFSASHRAHASIVGVAKFLPSYAGLLLEKEVIALEKVIQRPTRPFVAALGGAKIFDKLSLIRTLLRRADGIILGGALANTIFSVHGFETGKSVIDQAFKDTRGFYKNQKILLPYDVVVSRRVAEKVKTEIKKISEVSRNEFILDAGPETLALFAKSLRGAKTIVWNGPLGMSDFETFSAGTIAFARAIHKTRAFSVVGGGDTIAVLRRHNLLSGFSHASTGGGAMLEFLAGKKLPGVEALRK